MNEGAEKARELLGSFFKMNGKFFCKYCKRDLVRFCSGVNLSICDSYFIMTCSCGAETEVKSEEILKLVR